MGKTSRFLFNRFLEKFLCSIFACFLFTCAGVFSANALTVTYSCGTSTGTAPTDSTNYSSDDTVTVESNTCIVPSGEYFVGYVCGSKSVVPNDTFAITANTTCTAQYSGYKFNLTTTSVASFSFKISATGNFLVDCGDGGTLSGTGVSGNIITRSDTTIATYTCTWASAGAHTINFGGLATGYSNFTGDNKANANNSAAITFNTQASDGANYTNAVASISGSLGAIFPTLGSADTKQPAFVGTFKQCRSLTSVPATLFSGVSGTRANMFRETFDRCSNLTTVPPNLFANIAGAGKPSLFRSTFNQTKLPSIPAGIFSGVTSAASNLFRYTFGDVTTLTGYIPPSTFAGLIANGSPTATDMWSSTFINCSGLATSCDDFPGTEQVSTTYTGTVGDGLATTWNGRVSCQVLATYNVTYDCGSGASGTAPIDSNDYSHGDYVTTVSVANNTCTKSGSTFTGWSCGGYDVVPGETFLIEDDTTCTAQWSACTACAAINASCSLSVVNNVCTYTTECEEGFSDIQNNGAYNAYCSANKVIYDCGKGSGTAPIDSTDYVEGGTVTALENTCDAPSYEIFDYWDCNGNSVAAGDEFMISEDVTCEAQYTNGLVVSYDCGAGSGTVPTDDKGYVPGTSVTTANNTCTKSGNIFTGWSCDGNIVNAVSTFTISDNTTCTAQWSACTACATTNASCSLSVVNNVCTYMTECDSGYGRIQNNGSYNASCSLLNAHFVTYSCGTGSGTAPVDDTEHLYGSSVITVSVANNTCVAPSNSVFVGWSCDGNTVNAGSTFTISDDTTCTAQWSACTVCATTNASCSVSVVDNVCTYTTACESGYGNIQNNGAYNASCTALSSCTGANYEYDGTCVPCPYGYEYNIEDGKSSINQCQAHCSGGTTMTNYTRVAYLENSGDTTDGQFFDTNEFIETSNVKIEIGVGTAVTKSNTDEDYGNLFGNQTDSDGAAASYKKGVLGLWHEANSNKLSVNFVPMSADVQYDLVYVVNEPDKSITVSSNGNQLYFNSGRGAQKTASNVSLKIFASSAELQNGKITFPVKGDGLFDRGRVYYFKLWDGGDLKLDLIPVRNSNGVLGLYNNINGSFYPNAGTGTFNAGPDEYAFAVGTCQNVGDGYYLKAKTINYGSAAPSANRCPDDAPTNKQNASSILECEGFTCGSGRYYDETAEQCTDCTACSPTNATCSLGVVDNVCTYTTACESGYENIQHNGEYNPSCSAITYNVTYACGTGSGTAPTDNTNYSPGASVTTVANSCTAPSGKMFTGWSCAGTPVDAGSTFNISADTTCTAQYAKFAVTTMNLSANATFQFSMSATGTFTVDCGDGGVLTDNAATTTVSGNTITRSDTTSVTYTCTWTDAGVHKIRFDGAGTGYSTSSAAIRFRVGADDHAKDTNAAKVRAIDGSLSSLFPATGTANGQIPRFGYTFRKTSLTTLPANLFSGYTNATMNMFEGTFWGCSSLASIPATLFSSFTNSADAMFAYTFQSCTELASIPSGLFSSFTSGASQMFYQTFYGCTRLASLPSGLFSSFTSGASEMFEFTFTGCSGLTGYIPANFFGGFISNNVSYSTDMMRSVFSGTNLATSCDSYNGTERYYTPYDSYWDGKVSCAPANTGYYVTYACGTGAGGTTPTDSKQYANGYNVTTVTTANNTCTKSGYTFTGWSCGGNTVNAGSTFNISANTTCTAQWSECTACAATNASCELSVVNNTCTYTTTCNTHYGNIQNNGEYNASCSINSYTCSSGEYLPADGLACESCLRGHTCAGGTFNYNANDDQGIVINTYTCSSGQYLPANAIACETCPTGHTCAGGTFNFNAKDFQGLVLDTDSPIPANTNVCAENFPPSLKATYDINTYTCSPGYYLPADATECIKCLENNYCVGGSYTFNPTDNQGITHCSGDLRAPQGMWESQQCGRRFNVGGKYVYSRSTRKTSPSINLDMDLNGTTEFYISLSKIPVPMNVDFANLSQHNKLVIDLPKAYVNSVGVNVPAGKYYAYDDTMVFDLRTLDTSIEGTGYGYQGDNGARYENIGRYGLTTNGTWGASFSYGKLIGESRCSTTPGTWASASSVIPVADDGANCWCLATGFIDNDTNTTTVSGTPQPVMLSPWTLSNGLGSTETCLRDCAFNCAYYAWYYKKFRDNIFGQSDN